MNLAEYIQRPRTSGESGEFLKWTKNGESKVLRFLYTSHDGADIEVVKKCWNEEEHKFVYNTPEGKLTCVLKAVLYENGQEPKLVRWERSAAFTEQVCNGYWTKFPRIIDGVWEVTCTNPGTKDIKFSWFPIMGADLTNYPLPQGVSIQNGEVFYADRPQRAETPQRPQEPQAPSTPRKYWE